MQLANEGRKWVDETLKSMSLEEKVGQVLQIRYFSNFPNFDRAEFKRICEQLKKYNIDSLVLTIYTTEDGLLVRVSPTEAASVANELQRNSKQPLLIAADFEHVFVAPRGRSCFPDAMAFRAIGGEKDAGGIRRHHRARIAPAKKLCQ